MQTVKQGNTIMVNVAIKVLSVIAGIWCAFASYPWLNLHVMAVPALLGAVAVGILAGAAFYAGANWIMAELNTKQS